jgi:hypothetical protein
VPPAFPAKLFGVILRAFGVGRDMPVGMGPAIMNRWNIPDWLEREVTERDRSCVYCGVAFTRSEANRRRQPSWEHITNDTRIITRENIARCCIGCNASKGKKNLVAWLTSPYCAARGITGESVALVVRSYLASNS